MGDRFGGSGTAGGYLVVRFIASGGFGEVYEAVNDFTGARVALKVQHSRYAGDKRVSERMRSEAMLGGSAIHPNIVDVFDGGMTSDGRVWFVMPLFGGQTLRQLLDRQGAIPIALALRCGSQVAAGLAAAHAAGSFHRDVKPENIILLRDGSVRILDLGLAKYAGTVSSGEMVFGTTAYMSPEHLMGETMDGRADVYSLAHVIYELILGRHAFSYKSGQLPPSDVLAACQIRRRPTPLPRLVDGCPRAVWTLLSAALSVERDRRPTMAQFGSKLAKLADLSEMRERWNSWRVLETDDTVPDPVPPPVSGDTPIAIRPVFRIRGGLAAAVAALSLSAGALVAFQTGPRLDGLAEPAATQDAQQTASPAVHAPTPYAVALMASAVSSAGMCPWTAPPTTASLPAAPAASAPVASSTPSRRAPSTAPPRRAPRVSAEYRELRGFLGKPEF